MCTTMLVSIAPRRTANTTLPRPSCRRRLPPSPRRLSPANVGRIGDCRGGKAIMRIRGATALVAAGVGLAPVSGANAQLLNHKDLSLATALAIATAASDHCKAQGYEVS